MGSCVMLPDNELASLQMFNEWQYYYPMTDDLNIAYEQGGVGIGDVSEGLRSDLWKLQYISGELYLGKADETLVSVLSIGAGIVKVALAFDQSMRPVYAWQLNPVDCVLRFYDPTLSGYSQVTFEDIESPCLTLDDSRPESSTTTDVIFAYLKAGVLYYRQQRDRYLIEYTLTETDKKHLVRVGLSLGNRLQFMLK